MTAANNRPQSISYIGLEYGFRKESLSLKRLLQLLLILLLLFSSGLCEALVDGDVAITEDILVEYGYDYSECDEVALYLHAFEELPPNYLTKAEARSMGWDSRSGNLWTVAPGMSIGGDRFGNREGSLPEARGRNWYECDVNYFGGYRGAERLLFSSDGLIYYSGDHYQNFELLYEGWYWADGRYRYD